MLFQAFVKSLNNTKQRKLISLGSEINSSLCQIFCYIRSLYKYFQLYSVYFFTVAYHQRFFSFLFFTISFILLYCQLRARRVLSIFKDVSVENQKGTNAVQCLW